jgi:hypothetical protein
MLWKIESEEDKKLKVALLSLNVNFIQAYNMWLKVLTIVVNDETKYNIIISIIFKKKFFFFFFKSLIK